MLCAELTAATKEKQSLVRCFELMTRAKIRRLGGFSIPVMRFTGFEACYEDISRGEPFVGKLEVNSSVL